MNKEKFIMKRSCMSRRGLSLCLILGLFLGFQAPVLAATVYYNSSASNGGYMDEDSKWVGGAAPATGDYVYLTTDSAGDRSIFYRYVYNGSSFPLPNFQSLTIDNDGGGTMYLLSSSVYTNGRLSSNYVFIGYSGKGALTQSSGVVSVRESLTLGSSQTGDGRYSISGGALIAPDYELNLTVGSSGRGTFEQGGGSVDLRNGILRVGSASGSNGTYSLSGTGTLSARYEYIGSGGTGSFTQSAGTNRIGSYLHIGSGSGSSGSYTMSGGSLESSSSSFGLTVGSAGSGTFDQSGGTVNLGLGRLYVGYGSGSSSSYSLSDTGSLSAYSEIIAYSGTGTFTQTGGTNRIRSDLHIGAGLGSSGT